MTITVTSTVPVAKGVTCAAHPCSTACTGLNSPQWHMAQPSGERMTQPPEQLAAGPGNVGRALADDFSHLTGWEACS